MMQRRQIVKGQLGNNRGFTLIEIIAVLVVVAIISAVVISRGTATDAANLQAEIDTLKGHLRYAQALAMKDIYTTDTTSPEYATRTKWGISVGNLSYTLVKYVADAPATHTFNLPNESSATHSFNGITDASSTVNPILFDDWGSPGTANISITIGGQTITDAIKAQTGFIP
jgi:MSHA pilin protein MshC